MCGAVLCCVPDCLTLAACRYLSRLPTTAALYHAGGPTASGSSAFTFSPAINRASERLLEDSATVPADFQERLRYYSLRKQLRQQAAAGAADAEACTFRPDTGNAVQVLALSATRAGNLLETEQASCGCCACCGRCAFKAEGMRAPACSVCMPQHHSSSLPSRCYWSLMLCTVFYCYVQERYERLGTDEADRQAARRAAKEAEVYGGLRFQPQLNQRSLAMAPGGSGGMEALASAERRQRRLAELQRDEEARQRAECTFQASRAGWLGWLGGWGAWCCSPGRPLISCCTAAGSARCLLLASVMPTSPCFCLLLLCSACLQPDTSKPRVRGYYNEYQAPRAKAPLSIAAAAKQVRGEGTLRYLGGQAGSTRVAGCGY